MAFPKQKPAASAGLSIQKGWWSRGAAGLAEHKLPYAHDCASCPDLLSAIEALKPTALIGVSGVAGAFNKAVIEAMARHNSRPLIFALSNPTCKAECTAEQAYACSNGRALYASGSPFDPIMLGGRQLIPGQANNAYVFPGVGLGVISTRIRHVTESMFLAAARALAGQVRESDLEAGLIYPALARIREVSAAIAVAVAAEGYRLGLAMEPKPEDLAAYVKSHIFEPKYVALLEKKHSEPQS